MDKFVGES